MGLLYYISGLRRRPSDSDLARLKMPDCVCASFCPTDVGPDFKGGITFTIKGKSNGSEKVGYYHAEQEWFNVPDSDLWIGYDKENKPKPQDFLKSNPIDGHRIKLEDGNEWIIPLARRFESGCNLPKALSMLCGDKISYIIVARYLPLQKIAEKLLCLYPWKYESDEKRQQDFNEISDYPTQFKMCVEILSANYHINFLDISVLGLLSTSNTLEICKLLIDFPTAEDVENGLKKKELSFG